MEASISKPIPFLPIIPFPKVFEHPFGGAILPFSSLSKEDDPRDLCLISIMLKSPTRRLSPSKSKFVKSFHSFILSLDVFGAYSLKIESWVLFHLILTPMNLLDWSLYYHVNSKSLFTIERGPLKPSKPSP